MQKEAKAARMIYRIIEARYKSPYTFRRRDLETNARDCEKNTILPHSWKVELWQLELYQALQVCSNIQHVSYPIRKKRH